MQVRLFESKSDGLLWNEYLKTSAEGRVFHRWEWRQIYTSVFGFQPRYWAATEGDDVVGIFPGVIMRGLNLKKTWVSLPFSQYAGPIHDANEELEEFAQAVIDSECNTGIKNFQVRGESDVSCFEGWSTNKAYITMILALDSDPEVVWKQSLNKERRRQVKVARKNGFESVIGREELLDDFYQIWTCRINNLGTPVYPLKFFQSILESFGDDAFILAIRKDGVTVGARLVLRDHDRIFNIWAATLNEYNRLGANALLYWSIIEHACKLGCKFMDMGRSEPGSGTYVYKKSWGGSPQALTYSYFPQTKSMQGASTKYRLFIKIWRRQPHAFARWIGPHITPYLTDL